MALAIFTLTGCPFLNKPTTVASVDLDRYVGLWYQVAGYPFFPTNDLVGITAEYAKLPDGNVEVINRGFEGGFDGPEDTIVGVARVVDTETNAKLAVSFPSVLGGIFEGQYWIIDLDEDDYQYAVVSDGMKRTLFILSRTPVMEQAVYDGILARLAAQGFDLDRIMLTPQP